MKDKPDFVGHRIYTISELAREPYAQITNIIVEPKTDEDMWIKKTAERIGDWRAYFRSTYIRWALAINGLEIAQKRYTEKVGEPVGFTIDTLRPNGLTTIAMWDMKTTAKNYGDTMPMIAAWGVIDLYSCMEEFVFELYREYLNQHPESILKGDEFAELRRLRRAATGSPEDEAQWQRKWAERLDSWQRKRLYDGLHQVFLAYTRVAKLKTPFNYKNTTLETWAETMKGIAELRNCFTHGVETVTQELGNFSAGPYSLAFDFEEGKPLIIELRHLQSVECYLDQLLTGLNLSLLERAGYVLPNKP